MEANELTPLPLVESSLREAEWVARNLRRSSNVLAMTTGITLVFCVFVLAQLFFQVLPQINNGDAWFERQVLWIFVLSGMVTAASSLPLGIYFERRRRVAENVYARIVDVMQRIEANELTSVAGEERVSAEIELKYRLRVIMTESDLPLVPGRFGPAIYIAVNIVPTVFVALFALQFNVS